MSSLNAKTRLFVQEYLVDLNATKAAIRAGYSEKTAYSQGQRLLKNVEVQKAIEEAQKARAEKTETDAAFVLKRLVDEVSADLADLYDDNGSLKSVKEWPLIWRQGLVAGIETETIRPKGSRGTGQWHGKAQDVHDEEPPEEETVITKVKLSDRVKRLELLGKHISVNAFREQLGHSDPNGNPLPASPVDEMSKNDIARRVAFLLAQGLNSAAK